MNQFLLKYIAQRMEELGFDDYTLEPVIVYGTVNATNEYFYLIAKHIPSHTLIIRSHSNIYLSTDYNKHNLYGIQEFTGIITLSDVQAFNYPINYEFMRVIPRTKKGLDADTQKLLADYIEKFEL